MGALQTLLQLNILHTLVAVVSTLLVICLFVYMLLSWVPQWRDTKIGRFFVNAANPLVAPLDHIIPPINLGGMSISIGFFIAWWAIGAVGALLLQALPAGW